MRKNYGINQAQFWEMIKNQDGVCALCAEAFGETHHEKPVVDHCHKTGRLRGIIHHRCNIALGFLGDSPVRADGAAAYLRRSLTAANPTPPPAAASASA